MAKRFQVAIFVAAGAMLFGIAVRRLQTLPHPFVAQELSVRLPIVAQVVLSLGDRYLAANSASVRALVTDTSLMRLEEYAVLAGVQVDVAQLNPAHEDNYYTAAAILPWSGEVKAAQAILKAASVARPYDYQPAFLYAFHLLYFDKDPASAANWLRSASRSVADEDDRLTLQNLAAQWIERTNDLVLAINVIEAMAAQSKTPAFKRYLQARAERLRMLSDLRAAADKFVHLTSHPLVSLSQLVERGLIQSVPVDPLGIGFSVDANGVPVFSDGLKR